MLLMGSDIQPALETPKVRVSTGIFAEVTKAVTHNSAIAMYGHELTNPISQEFESQVPAAVQAGPVSAIPKACGKDKFAPLAPTESNSILAMETNTPAGGAPYLSDPIPE
jgi:hypothetical protein